LEEFADTVGNRKLDERQLQMLSRFPKDEHGIKTVDSSNLTRPVAPANCTFSELTWKGLNYYFTMKDENGTSLYFICLAKEVYERHVSDEYEEIYENNLVTITKEEKVEERNADVIYYTTPVSDIKTMIYTFQEGQTQYTVFETYLLRHNNSELTTSDVVPANFMLHMKNGDYHAQIYFNEFTERPTVEYLKQFNVAKFVP